MYKRGQLPLFRAGLLRLITLFSVLWLSAPETRAQDEYLTFPMTESVLLQPAFAE